MRGRELSVNIGQLEHVVEVIRFSSFALAAKARHFRRVRAPDGIRKSYAASAFKSRVRICEVDLQDRDSFAIPFFLVCKVGCPPETVELMIAFFREKLG